MLDFEIGAFRRWLLAQPAGSVVGYVGHSYYCPLARWLSQECGGECRVYGGRYCVDGEWVDAPAWMVRLVAEVDALGDERVVTVGQVPGWVQVTREQVLQVLEHVLEEEEGGR